jgi:hypothetical protein
MFLTLKMLKTVKNIEITDLELCFIDFPIKKVVMHLKNHRSKGRTVPLKEII